MSGYSTDLFRKISTISRKARLLILQTCEYAILFEMCSTMNVPLNSWELFRVAILEQKMSGCFLKYLRYGSKRSTKLCFSWRILTSDWFLNASGTLFKFSKLKYILKISSHINLVGLADWIRYFPVWINKMVRTKRQLLQFKLLLVWLLTWN